MATQRTKNSLISGVLSFVIPGLGHVYLGKWQRGLLWMAGIIGYVVAQHWFSPVEFNNLNYSVILVIIVAYDAIISTYEVNGQMTYKPVESKFFRGALIVYGIIGLASYINGLNSWFVQEYYTTVPTLYYIYWSISGVVFLGSMVATYRLKKIGVYILLGLITADTLAGLYFERFTTDIDPTIMSFSLSLELSILMIIFFLIRRRWTHFS